MSEQSVETVTITVDGKVIEAKPGEMIIAAAERGGVYIPRFCWHPRMKPVGMCRMCLVEVNGPRGFALLPSCFVPVADGQEVVTTSDKVKKAQDGVLEFLLINHPLDCPVCDRGGECPLQDQTFAFGPGESRFVEEKRHWAKPIPINPLVALDRERCIQCARCTRFAEEVAGDPLIDFVGRADATEVGIFEDEPFESNFSGNVVQICPVGALTATPYRFKARPWDLDMVESTCTVCAVGCRMSVQSSADRIIRNLGIDSDPVNHGWLCDKGRFGYEAVDSAERLTKPRVRQDGALVETTWSAAITAAAAGLRRALDADGPRSVAVLGGARLPNEDAYAWSKLARAVLGTDNVDCQMGDGLPAQTVLGLPRATIDEACKAPALLVLAPDLKEELPVLFLRLREAAVEGWTKAVEITPQPSGITPHAAASLVYRPGEAAKVAAALVARLSGAEAAADGRIARAAEILAAGVEAGEGGVVVVLGRPSVAEGADSIAHAASIIADGVPGARFLPALRRGNVLGALDAGLAPGVLPGRVSLADGRAWYEEAWSCELPAEEGLDAQGILQLAAAGGLGALVLVGADPLRDFPDRDLATRALAGARFTVAVDLHSNDSNAGADVVLPAAGWGERAGTTTNIEGRVSRLGQKVTGPGTSRPDWMIAAELARALGKGLGFDTLESVAAEVERLAPTHVGFSLANGGGPGFRDGVVLPLANGGGDGLRPPMLRPTPRSGRAAPPVDAYSLRLVSGRMLYDAGTGVQRSPSLAGLASGARLRSNPADLDDLGIRTGDSVRVTSSRGSLTVEALADPSVPRGSASLAFNLAGEGAADLIDVAQPVTDIRLESLA